MEYMDLDEFLSENGIPVKDNGLQGRSPQQQQQTEEEDLDDVIIREELLLPEYHDNKVAIALNFTHDLDDEIIRVVEGHNRITSKATSSTSPSTVTSTLSTSSTFFSRESLFLYSVLNRFSQILPVSFRFVC